MSLSDSSVGECISIAASYFFVLLLDAFSDSGNVSFFLWYCGISNDGSVSSALLG